MTGMELRRYVEYSGLTMSDIARELDTSPQNVRSKMIKERVSADFAQKVEDVIQKYKEEIGTDSNFLLEQPEPSEEQKPSTILESVLMAKVERLESENFFLRKQVETLLAIVGQK